MSDHLADMFLLYYERASELQHQVHKQLAIDQYVFPFFLFPTASWADRIHTMEFPESDSSSMEKQKLWRDMLRCLA